VEGEIFRTCPDRPWGPPSLLYNGYRVIPGGKNRPGRDADPSTPSSGVGHERVELYLYSPYGRYGLYRVSVPVQVCTLPYSRAIPLLHLWAVRPVQSLSACTRVHFTFTCSMTVPGMTFTKPADTELYKNPTRILIAEKLQAGGQDKWTWSPHTLSFTSYRTPNISGASVMIRLHNVTSCFA
jgi:hypothetical protein